MGSVGLAGLFSACGGPAAAPAVGSPVPPAASSHSVARTSRAPHPVHTPLGQLARWTATEPVSGVTTEITQGQGASSPPVTVRWTVDPAQHAMEMSETLPGGVSVEMIRIRNRAWMHETPPGGPWQTIPAPAAATPAPGRSLLADWVQVRAVGSRVWSGHATTGYRGVLNAAGLRQLSGNGGASSGQHPVQVQAATLTMWLGARGHVWAAQLTESAHVSGVAETIQADTLYHHWGEPVTIRPPVSGT